MPLFSFQASLDQAIADEDFDAADEFNSQIEALQAKIDALPQ